MTVKLFLQALYFLFFVTVCLFSLSADSKPAEWHAGRARQHKPTPVCLVILFLAIFGWLCGCGTFSELFLYLNYLGDQ